MSEAVIIALAVIVLFVFLGMSPYDIPRPFKFSLRTLLIATTALAVVLGLIAWFARTG